MVHRPDFLRSPGFVSPSREKASNITKRESEFWIFSLHHRWRSRVGRIDWQRSMVAYWKQIGRNSIEGEWNFVQSTWIQEAKLLQQNGYIGENFRKHWCFFGIFFLGRHYFYNISRTMTQKDFHPFFVLYSITGDLAGWGFNAFGSKAVKKSFSDYIPFVKKRNWFENVPSSKVRVS